MTVARFDDTKRYVDSTPNLSAADKQKVFEGNALKVYPRLKAQIEKQASGDGWVRWRLLCTPATLLRTRTLEGIMKIVSSATATKLAVAAALLLAQGLTTQAAEIKALGVVPLRTSVNVLAPQFEQATGHKVTISYAGSSDLIKRFAAGETFDVALVWPAMIERLLKEGKVAAGTRTDIARVAVGVAVKKGAPKPDISTADAVKRTLVNAKSVSHSAEGASGVYLQKLLKRFGIAEEMKPKLRPVPGGPLVVGPVARGEVELAVISIPFVFLEPGAELVGPLPAELQEYVVYTAGISATAQDAGAAGAFVRHLTSPAAASALKSQGLDPAAP